MKPIFPAEVSPLRLSAPALFALALGVGCGTLALAQTVALPSFTPLIWSAWALALTFCILNRLVTQRACRAQQNGEKRGADWALWAVFQWLAWGAALMFCILPPLTVMGGFTVLVPSDVVNDDNLKVAVFVGWVCIGIVFLGGASTGQTQPMLSTRGRSALLGEAPVPLAVALFPTLSLFGLLNIITVDTPVMVAFFAFLAASLYLVGYENYLDQALNRRSAAAPDSQKNGATTTSRASTRGAARRSPATQYIAICAVWLATFGAVAAAFFYPLTAILPRASLSLDFARKQAPPGRASTDDWRAPAQSFSLRGGSYALSEEEIARVETAGAPPSALWRGRIYENYSSGADAFANKEEAASRWEVVDARDTAVTQENDNDGEPVALLPLYDELLQSLDAPEMGDAKNIGSLDAWSRVQPLTTGIAGLSDVIFSLGQPIAASGSFETITVRPDGTVRLDVPKSTSRYSTPRQRRRRHNGGGSSYQVRSRVPQPNLVELRKAPGLNDAQLQKWRDNPITATSLDVPQNDATRAGFAKIIAQIETRERDAGRRIETPSQRADAIARFLTDTCEYSLNVPTIPPTEDAALFFMTSSKRGACDMFASSMTLLLRSMNVPARLATGFVQPDLPDAGGSGNAYTLRGTDAHAWVEYFVPQIGWMTFDPTEGTRLANESLSAQVGELLKLPAQWKAFATPAAIAALAITAFAGAAFFLLSWRRRDREKPGAPIDAQAAGRARIRVAYARAQQMIISRAALPAGVSPRTLTPREWENAVLAQPLTGDAKSEFAALTYLFDLASYAPALPAGSADATQLQASLARLRAALKTPRK